MRENTSWCSREIELSENKHYLELETVVGYYNYPNANGRQMDYGETAEEQAATLALAQTLVNMPVKAKYTKNAQGLPTFRGHEAKKLATGEVIFGTEKIGTHTEVRIEPREVETFDHQKMTLPCLIAKQVIWKDNKNVVAAIQRLFNLGKLYTSWEVVATQYHFKDGIKYLTDYAFIGDALLGYEYATPAYGVNAEVVSVASEQEEQMDCEWMVAEALSMDMLAREGDEVKRMEKEDKKIPAVEEAEAVVEEQTPAAAEQTPAAEGQAPAAEQAEDTPVQDTEVSALTMRDIHDKLRKAVNEKSSVYAWVSMVFPEEKRIWVKTEGMLDLEFDQYEYQVEGDTVTIGDPIRIRMELPLMELSEGYKTRGEQVEKLEAEVAELKPYKEKWEAAEAQKVKEAHEAAVAELSALASEAGCFAEEELASGEIAEMIEQERAAELKAAIFDRTMKKKSVPEMAEVTKQIAPRRSLAQDEGAVDKIGAMRKFLHRA